MNLYRSFGNLMEAWVSEGGQVSDSEWLGNNDEGSATPSSDAGTNLRSESVDSGVETASSDTSFPATSCSVLTDNAEMETFTPERESLTPASTSQSPVVSSPSPSSTFLHQKVEQALKRTESEHLKDNPEPLIEDNVLRRRPRASILPKRHTSDVVRGQRPESFGLWWTASSSPASMRPTRRRPTSMICDKRQAQSRLQTFAEDDEKGLSPGLNYLEQVCQMLEEVARQRIQNQAIQMETNAQGIQGDLVEEAFDPSYGLESGEEHISSEPQRRKEYRHGHFRQRSASDTTLTTLHLRKTNTNCRGQHMSTDDLLEKVEEENEKQEPKKTETIKSSRSWRLKIGSLRRDDSVAREIKGQQKQSSEKNAAWRRLSQLFRRNRRKTT